MQTLLQLLRKGEDFLKQKGIEKPRLEAQLLFCHILKMSRIDLFVQEQKPLTTDEITALRAALVQRAAGKPLAYIVSEKHFYGRPFYVSEDVLIPRPETEELVELALKQPLAGTKVLDLGCGSGCIGITLALEAALQCIHFSDISEKALFVTKKNFAKLVNTKENNLPEVKYYQADLLDTFVSEKVGFYDLVISNPPYVLPEEFGKLDHEVRGYEPELALVVYDAPKFFSTMFHRCAQVLQPRGLLLLETSPSLIELQKILLLKNGFTDIEVFLDLCGKERFIKGVKA